MDIKQIKILYLRQLNKYFDRPTRSAFDHWSAEHHDVIQTYSILKEILM